MTKFTAALLGAAAAIATPGAANAQNLLVNGGFETGDFTGWTFGNPSARTFTTNTPGFVYEGDFSAILGTVGGETTLSQTIATTVGETYSIGFALGNAGGAPNSASVRFGSTLLDAIVDVDPFDFVYLRYAGVATTASTVLQFTYRHDDSFFALDDVSVEQGAPVPEPATWAMMILGFGAVGGAMRRRATVRFRMA